MFKIFLFLGVLFFLVWVILKFGKTNWEKDDEDQKKLKLDLEFERKEKGIRKDAIKKSKSTILGKAFEIISPYLPGFTHNPKDLRHLGDPIDYIVFDSDEEGNIERITFLEMKTNNSRLNKRQKQIKKLIEDGEVYFEEYRVNLEKRNN